MPVWLKDKLHIAGTMRSEVGVGQKLPVIFADHHESHAASAFFPSPFESAPILTLDGVGEWSTTTLGSGRDNQLG
jgi:carbamoyltransferase